MTQAIRFTKMQGAGNDYIYVDVRKEPVNHPSEVSKVLSRPHFGIGSDGLVLIGNSTVADFSMRIFNADGSEAQMCGNASRCIGKYVYEKGLTTKKEIRLETLSGIKILYLNVTENRVQDVTVDMGVPKMDGLNMEIKVPDQIVSGRRVSMGNPHFVIFIDDMTKVRLAEIGPQIEHAEVFPEGTNVEFVEIHNRHEVRARVWERGSGITMACGTGSCAVAAACMQSGKTEERMDVIMDGGTLTVTRDQATGHLLMRGPAAFVFEGTVTVD